jgi:hypothetical protein
MISCVDGAIVKSGVSKRRWLTGENIVVRGWDDALVPPILELIRM